MNFSHFFIRRPIFAGVLSILIFIVGLIAMWRLPISEYPEVVLPTIVVHATYPGANPKTIADEAARRSAPSRRHYDEAIARPHNGRAPVFAKWTLRRGLHPQLRDFAS